MGETYEIGESTYKQIKDFPYDELVKNTCDTDHC